MVHCPSIVLDRVNKKLCLILSILLKIIFGIFVQKSKSNFVYFVYWQSKRKVIKWRAGGFRAGPKFQYTTTQPICQEKSCTKMHKILRPKLCKIHKSVFVKGQMKKILYKFADNILCIFVQYFCRKCLTSGVKCDNIISVKGNNQLYKIKKS